MPGRPPKPAYSQRGPWLIAAPVLSPSFIRPLAAPCGTRRLLAGYSACPVSDLAVCADLDPVHLVTACCVSRRPSSLRQRPMGLRRYSTKKHAKKRKKNTVKSDGAKRKTRAPIRAGRGGWRTRSRGALTSKIDAPKFESIATAAGRRRCAPHLPTSDALAQRTPKSTSYSRRAP